MIRWGGKEDTLILRMLETEGINPPAPWHEPEDYVPPANPPPEQTDPVPDPPVDNPVPDDEGPPESADLPEVDEYVAEPIDPPPLPAGVFPGDADTWVRGTIIERNQTRLIRLDTSYTSAASDFFGDDGSSIVEVSSTLSFSDGEFTLVGIAGSFSIATTAALNAGVPQPFVSLPATYNIQIGDTFRLDTGEEYFVDTIGDGGFSANVQDQVDGIQAINFEIDITTEEVVVDPVVETYTDNQVDFYEITRKYNTRSTYG
jgi:hypothetical protein